MPTRETIRRSSQALGLAILLTTGAAAAKGTRPCDAVTLLEPGEVLPELSWEGAPDARVEICERAISLDTFEAEGAIRGLVRAFYVLGFRTKEEYHEVDPDPRLAADAEHLLTVIELEAADKAAGEDGRETWARIVLWPDASVGTKEEYHEVDPDPRLAPTVTTWTGRITTSAAGGAPELLLQLFAGAKKIIGR